MGGDAVTNQGPCWNYNSSEGTEARKHMTRCVLEGMRKCIKKPVNYERVKGVAQEEKEIPALFHGRLVESFRKYANIDPSTPEGQYLLWQNFFSQSVPYIRWKLKKLPIGSQTPMPQLLEVAFGCI